MKLLYTRSDVDTFNPKFKHIFLAGPSPRSPLVKSWRPEAIRILRDLNFSGVIYVPEPSNPERFGDTLSESDYKEQIRWEHAAISKSDVVFWVPRSHDLPGFTTNVEFGWLIPNHPNKVSYGRPETANHTNYLDLFYVKWRNLPIYSDLTQLLRGSIS